MNSGIITLPLKWAVHKYISCIIHYQKQQWVKAQGNNASKQNTSQQQTLSSVVLNSTPKTCTNPFTLFLTSSIHHVFQISIYFTLKSLDWYNVNFVSYPSREYYTQIMSQRTNSDILQITSRYLFSDQS